MRLAQDNDVVHTLTPDRSDQPFGKAILPRRGWCSRLVPDAHGAQSACDDGAVDPISIVNEIALKLWARRAVPVAAALALVVGSAGLAQAHDDEDDDVGYRHALGEPPLFDSFRLLQTVVITLSYAD